MLDFINSRKSDTTLWFAGLWALTRFLTALAEGAAFDRAAVMFLGALVIGGLAALAVGWVLSVLSQDRISRAAGANLFLLIGSGLAIIVSLSRMAAV